MPMQKPKLKENNIINGGKVGIDAELFSSLGKYETCMKRINASPEINAIKPR